jgi:hypothetical protein
LNTSLKNILNEDSLVVKEADVCLDDSWITFISNNPQATIHHHPDWLKILELETGQSIIRLVCTDNEGAIHGLLPLQFTKGFPFGLGGIPGSKRLASLPRSPVGGPLAYDSKVMELLLKRATKIVSNQSECYLQIKSFDSEINQSFENLYKYHWRDIYIKEIPDYPEEIRYGKSKNHAKIKWAVNKAEQNNVIRRTGQSEDDLKRWYPLYLDTMRSNTTPARSYDFFKNLLQILGSKGLMKLDLAEIEENNKKIVIAGCILFFYNKTVTHAFSGSSRIRKHIELRPNDLLHWYAILDAQKNNYKYYDFGEVSRGNTGLATYKKKWDTVKKDMYHYYYPKPGQLQAQELDSATTSGIREKVWQKLPLSVTAHLGKMIYKRL